MVMEQLVLLKVEDVDAVIRGIEKKLLLLVRKVVDVIAALAYIELHF